MNQGLKTFESSGHTYAVGRLEPFQQLHVVRKLSPVLASGLDAKLLDGVHTFADLKEIGLATLLRSMAIPFSQAVASMENADVEFIVRTCLGVCKRREDAGGGNVSWAAVMSPNGNLMYQDIELMDMFRIVSEVVKTNLASFFAIAQQNSQDSVPA